MPARAVRWNAACCITRYLLENVTLEFFVEIVHTYYYGYRSCAFGQRHPTIRGIDFMMSLQENF